MCTKSYPVFILRKKTALMYCMYCKLLKPQVTQNFENVYETHIQSHKQKINFITSEWIEWYPNYHCIITIAIFWLDGAIESRKYTIFMSQLSNIQNNNNFKNKYYIYQIKYLLLTHMNEHYIYNSTVPKEFPIFTLHR